MAHAHIQRLKDRLSAMEQDTLVLTALTKSAYGESLNADEKAIVDEFKKQRALEQRLSERFDLGGVIEKVLRGPTSNQDGPASYSAGVTRGAADSPVLDPAEMRKTTKSLRERAGLPEVNYEVRPDGSVPTNKQTRPKSRVKWAPGSGPAGGK